MSTTFWYSFIWDANLGEIVRRIFEKEGWELEDKEWKVNEKLEKIGLKLYTDYWGKEVKKILYVFEGCPADGKIDTIALSKAHEKASEIRKKYEIVEVPRCSKVQIARAYLF